ncbi:Dystonin [Araneus ventricosus]|uniref:Dystonin n=1 Tax=Araneus ventricosus TaxID=182803 RepID=A0A4Y2N9C9_ARAVE|nr:Dystonin [Araneus ventricosus]
MGTSCVLNPSLTKRPFAGVGRKFEAGMLSRVFLLIHPAGKELYDLFEDLRDGHNLISLLEVLSNEILPREKGSMRFHMLQNVQIALNFLRFRKIKLVNIRAEDIVDGNPKLTLGLIWTIILHFQVSDHILLEQKSLICYSR